MMKSIKLIALAAIVSSMAACTAITDITSSTSSTLDAATPDVTLNNFIDTRYAAIRQDAARGQGENIVALSQLMGEADSAQLAGWLQANYDQLFTQVQTSSELVAKLEEYRTLSKG